MPLPWSKGCCGGRKTRSNSRTNLFSSYLSNGEESAKKDHGNEFRGSKNGGREVWVSLEWPENRKSGDPPWRLALRSPARSGRVRRRLALKFHGDGRPVVALLPGRRVEQGGGRCRLPRPKPVWSKNGSKRPSSVFTVLGNFL